MWGKSKREVVARPGDLRHTARMSTAVALTPFKTWYSARVLSRPEMMGGAPCFGTTRLPVATVGGRMLGGDTVESIRTDYPYLSVDDVAFAVEYVRRHSR